MRPLNIISSGVIVDDDDCTDQHGEEMLTGVPPFAMCADPYGSAARRCVDIVLTLRLNADLC